MNFEDTPINRVRNLVMEYALRYGLTYAEAEAVFREAVEL